MKKELTMLFAAIFAIALLPYFLIRIIGAIIIKVDDWSEKILSDFKYYEK